MASETDFPLKATVIAAAGGYVVIQPSGTNYELQLEVAGGPTAFVAGQQVRGVIRVSARKLWTVPTGGNFVTPIFGPPRILQGRVRWLQGNTMVLHAGLPVIVDLPEAASAKDMTFGQLAVGGRANVALFAGARFEALAEAPA